MNINIRSIKIFQNISDNSIKDIEKNAEIYNYKMGQPIINNDFIPNKVLIILSGTARILFQTPKGTITLAKLKTDDIIGSISILRATPCEKVNASSDVIVLALSDNLILRLYNQESSLREYFNKNIETIELAEFADNYIKNTAKTNLDILSIINIYRNESTLRTFNDGDILTPNSKFINILSSSNVINRTVGQVIEKDEIIKTRGPFPARVLEIAKNIDNKLIEQDSKIKNSLNTDILNLNNSKNEIKAGIDEIEISQEKVGQYVELKKFKVIKASGISQEAMACLKMIAIEMKLPYRVDAIDKIIQDSIKRGKKPTIQLLGGITSIMGLHSSIIKIKSNVAKRLPSNSLINWDNSFAIIKDANSNYIEIVSPTIGIQKISFEEFKIKFKDDIIEVLILDKNEQTPEIKFGLRWLLPSINKYRNVLLQVLLASFVVQLIGLANPLMIQVIIDKVISQRSLDTLQILGFALVVATILGGVISSLRTFLFNETTNRIDTRLGSEVIDHLLRLPLDYFDRRPVGELGSRISELEKIRNFLTGQALTTILDAIFSLIYVVIMVIYSWLLTLIALGVVPLQVIITLIGTPLIRRQIREVAIENAKTQSHLVEVLTGIQTVKAQNVERVSRWKWQEFYSQYISKTFQKTITGTALNETSQVLQQLSQLLVLWVGASLVLKGQMSLGQLIAFRIISGYVTQPLLRLSTIWQNIQELRVSFERLADIVDTPEETNETDKAKIPLPSIKGNISFENISFSFKRESEYVLNHVDLEVNAGQFVGIVGQSGSGKSTLVKLLPRLYSPKIGRVLVDGYDINKVELYSLRRQIGIVPQEPLLFAGSINDNISLTDPEASSDEIVKAAKLADAHDFIMELDDGYSTYIGERGAGLSGGQKQRIAIARTLLSNPKLLIMDEATSALDYQTEKRVCEGLRGSSKGSTVFFITHRLSTVKNADLIVMLHKGSIVEKGTHDELINRKGRYFALYRQQESS